MQQIGAPPQSQKPLDERGYFNVIWCSFFMKMYDQMNKTNEIETIVNFKSDSQYGAGSNSELSKRLDELEIELLYGSSGTSSGETDLSELGIVPYKIYDTKSVVLNNYEYLNIDFTGEYIIEGTGSLVLNGNSFLVVSGGGI